VHLYDSILEEKLASSLKKFNKYMFVLKAKTVLRKFKLFILRLKRKFIFPLISIVKCKVYVHNKRMRVYQLPRISVEERNVAQNILITVSENWWKYVNSKWPRGSKYLGKEKGDE